ncbi:DsbA family oxidoreductase [Roseomonas sp. PWR1]|uniref:DsbA family oxidoreductase n=1 Tax=Roseomonas nitratireducens TaxID=2820810 RepID=A0ABS4ANC5_9PROT|nr:DsbA family oxidoreductase [Neoroseomonas nitratireducens]
MNLLVPPRSRLQIEVVFDLVCPWCYLGTRRLRRALRARPDIVADLHWRPFLLNPDIPAGGLPRHEFLTRKFGGEERARRLHATIAELGVAEGVPFHFERIRRMPSSLDAHRLVRFASRDGLAEPMVDALFHAHFAEGADLGDDIALVALAARVGLDPVQVRRFLDSGSEADAVHAENLRAHRLGINGVPCFVMGGRHAIAGAQEPEVLERLIDVAMAEA